MVKNKSISRNLNLARLPIVIFPNVILLLSLLSTVTFIDCHFNSCNFNSSKINHAAFRTVFFNTCKMTDVNFAMCDKFIFEVHFKDCILDFSKFYALKMKGTTFTNTSLVAVDFMSTNLTEVLFSNCDLYRSEFEKAIADKADLNTKQ